MLDKLQSAGNGEASMERVAADEIVGERYHVVIPAVINANGTNSSQKDIKSSEGGVVSRRCHWQRWPPGTAVRPLLAQIDDAAIDTLWI